MKWHNKNKKQSEEQPSMTLSDVIRGIQHCVNSSLEIIEQYYLNMMQKYITEDENIIIKRINIDNDHYMDLPLICLTGHDTLQIDKMKVKMKVNIRDMDLKQSMVDLEGDNEETESEYMLSRTSMLVDVCNVKHEEDGTNMEVQMTFTKSDPPESISRVIETLNNAIAIKMRE